MRKKPTLRLVTGDEFRAAMRRKADTGRYLVAKGARIIAAIESHQSAIDCLEQQIAEIKARFPQQQRDVK
mgnify:CR=1 FL=1